MQMSKSDAQKGYEAKWLRNNPRKALLNRVKSRAAAQGVPFDLTLANIDWPTHCPVFGTELRYVRAGGTKRGGKPDSASVDRLDPDKGYVASNVRIMSWRANKLKSDATLTELEKLAAYVRQETAAVTTFLSPAENLASNYES